MKNVISTTQAPQAIGPYSQGICFENLVFTSGQIPLKPNGELVEGGIKEQVKQSLENLKAVLESAGSSLEKVIKTTVFLSDMNNFSAMNEVYGEYFSGNSNVSYPARSAVEVARLPKDVLVEIECIGYR